MPHRNDMKRQAGIPISRFGGKGLRTFMVLIRLLMK